MADGFQKISTGEYEIVKDPDAILDYTYPWTEWLNGDAIASAVITIADSATMAKATSADHASIPATGQAISGGNVIVWLKGGAARDRASVACRIATTGGRTDERTFYVRVENK